MAFIPLLRRVVLALVLMAGSWEDILPGVEDPEGREVAPPAPSSSIPSSDADDDAGDGLVWSHSPPEPVLISETNGTLLIPLESQLLPGAAQKIHAPVFIRRIPHVPKLSSS